MWAAYFQENGAMRHTIAVAKFEHTVQYKLDEFVKRMSHPSVGIWWVWIEESEDDDGNQMYQGETL